mmetsp:Transcript_50696/g.158368  ORF Transcript_50696/g.158368 Transcript_50696/m.158368 type:complete len:243 (-) Transcript_50696:968-1696(-)
MCFLVVFRSLSFLCSLMRRHTLRPRRDVVIAPHSFIGVSICPYQFPEPVTKVIAPLPFILVPCKTSTVSPSVKTLTVGIHANPMIVTQIVLPVALIAVPVRPRVFPVTVFLVFVPISAVFIARQYFRKCGVRHQHFHRSSRVYTPPLAKICYKVPNKHVFVCIFASPFSLTHVVLPHPVIDVAVNIFHRPAPMPFVIQPCTVIQSILGVRKAPDSVHHSRLPLSFIFIAGRPAHPSFSRFQV